MIPLSLGGLLLVYACGTATLLFLIWGAAIFLRGRGERGRRRRIIQCMFCGTLYEQSRETRLPPCPQCARPNEHTPPPSV